MPRFGNPYTPEHHEALLQALQASLRELHEDPCEATIVRCAALLLRYSITKWGDL